MSRAELEARVRMELNHKLATINSFLRQHAEQCDKIDDLRNYNNDEIRQQLTLAEQQLRVSYYYYYTLYTLPLILVLLLLLHCTTTTSTSDTTTR